MSINDSKVDEILGPERIRRMVRECPVRFEVEPDQTRRETIEHRWQSDTRHPVAAVRRHRQRGECVGIDHAEEMVDVALEDLHVFDRARRGRARGCGATASSLISRRPVSSPTGAAPARQNFSPLYSGGIVGGSHDDAGEVHRTGDVVERIGGDLAEIGDIDAGAR